MLREGEPVSIWYVGTAIQRKTGGRSIRLDSGHLTLALSVEVSANRLDHAIGVGRGVDAAALTFGISRLRPPTVARVGAWD